MESSLRSLTFADVHQHCEFFCDLMTYSYDLRFVSSWSHWIIELSADKFQI